MTKPKSRLPILAGPSIHRSQGKGVGKEEPGPRQGQQEQRKYGVLALL
mgnify:CR=1 FL=1